MEMLNVYSNPIYLRLPARHIRHQQVSAATPTTACDNQHVCKCLKTCSSCKLKPELLYISWTHWGVIAFPAGGYQPSFSRYLRHAGKELCGYDWPTSMITHRSVYPNISVANALTGVVCFLFDFWAGHRSQNDLALLAEFNCLCS